MRPGRALSPPGEGGVPGRMPGRPATTVRAAAAAAPLLPVLNRRTNYRKNSVCAHRRRWVRGEQAGGFLRRLPTSASQCASIVMGRTAAGVGLFLRRILCGRGHLPCRFLATYPKRTFDATSQVGRAWRLNGTSGSVSLAWSASATHYRRKPVGSGAACSAGSSELTPRASWRSCSRKSRRRNGSTPPNAGAHR
jgi:hypothetical protein